MNIVCLVEVLLIIRFENIVILILSDSIDVIEINFGEINIFSIISLTFEVEPIIILILTLSIILKFISNLELLLTKILIISLLLFTRITTSE